MWQVENKKREGLAIADNIDFILIIVTRHPFSFSYGLFIFIVARYINL